MNWLTIDFVVCLIVLVLAGLLAWQQYSHQKVVKDLINRIMARNYGEIVQGEMLGKPVEIKPFDVKVKDDSEEPPSVDTLNQIL